MANSASHPSSLWYILGEDPVVGFQKESGIDCCSFAVPDAVSGTHPPRCWTATHERAQKQPVFGGMVRFNDERPS